MHRTRWFGTCGTIRDRWRAQPRDGSSVGQHWLDADTSVVNADSYRATDRRRRRARLTARAAVVLADRRVRARGGGGQEAGAPLAGRVGRVTDRATETQDVLDAVGVGRSGGRQRVRRKATAPGDHDALPPGPGVVELRNVYDPARPAPGAQQQRARTVEPRAPEAP